MTGPQTDTIRRNAVSGAVAGVIFVIIAVLTGGSAAFVIVGAVLVFIVATLIGYAIGTYYDRRRAG